MKRRDFGLGAISLLSACTSNKNDPVITNEFGAFSRKVSFNAIGAEKLKYNSPQGLTVRCFALFSPHLFLSYDYYSIAIDSELTLRSTLLKAYPEFAIQKNEDLLLGTFDLPDETRFIGAIVGYQDTNSNKWRSVLKLDLNRQNHFINISVESQKFDLKYSDIY